MKRSIIILAGIILLLLANIRIRHLSIPSRSFKPSGPLLANQAAEGTAEDAMGRLRHEWLRLRDPLINQIPRNIGIEQLRFAKKLIEETQGYPSISTNWVTRGPWNIGGRTRALAIDLTNENVIIAGGVSGGIWKSTDGGQTWRKTTAPDQLHSVSCIAQNCTTGKEHIWYFGTGEYYPTGGTAAYPNLSDAFFRGDGIFKSIDSGEHWYPLQSTISNTPENPDPFDYISGLVTFPPDGIFAATSNGLFKSNDGGESWQRVLYFGENYRSTEIAMTPKGICFATIGGIGPDNGVYRSEDGNTWHRISPPDWPDTTRRIAIGIAPSNENIAYFFCAVTGLRTQLWKYEHNSGWTNLTSNLPYGGELTTYGGHMMIVRVKPDDENVLFLGTVGLYRSRDGGKSFEVIGAYGDFHVDQHAIVFLPSNPKAMIVGNDGGLFKTNDNLAEPSYDPKTGEHHIAWQSLNNGYLTTQFYSVAIDHTTSHSEVILGGTQDNAFLFTTTADSRHPWDFIFGGAMDGGFTAISDGGNYWYGTQAGSFAVWRFDFATGSLRWTNITPSALTSGTLWLPPFLLDAHDSRIMYLPWQNQLWRNSDLTQIPHKFPPTPTDVNWERLQHIAGDAITALGMSPALPRRLYYATFGWSNGAKLFKLDDPHMGQPNPVEITGSNFPYYPYSPLISCIAVDPINPDKLLVAFPNYGVISIYASDDGGGHWLPIAGNLEQFPDGTGSGPSVRWLSILYVKNTPVIFAGTSIGLFSTIRLDGMNTIWVSEGATSIGNVVIDMIDVRGSDGYVVVGTHGNGVYSTYVTELPSGIDTSRPLPKGFVLYPTCPNPFNETTTIRFDLPSAGQVRLRVLNLLGQEVAILLDKTLPAGSHRLDWTASRTTTGIYFIQLKFENWTAIRKTILQR
ncbi:MAG: T9SS type A sorting domain-containing protein [candidate division KSB1 bacterium]|nr:T9SS type A sorting domain-containing protein [candidate division KSB1 bacterium]MDZ7335150.1 T9SS type A sorting domain-containing protein [candidate division KSB1 bacterium]MDZ7356833.1 T9SS type A sorting domain-containing protein [candidate division KSB1 bacterium]MDZ7376197.1 T9SS type A sorting domain-containing protein [candidate division KSB1 bacterium]MDZ7401328.1 T9SS type A sorting domain-containing protein [candidate division KSB1 bacterium]